MTVIKRWWERGKIGVYIFIGSLLTSSAFGDLPTPPSSDIADSTHDWIDVGGLIGYKTLKIVCIIVGVVLLISAVGGIIRAYDEVHKPGGSLGHFFKVAIVGLIAAAIGAGLLYAAYAIIPTTS